MTTPLHLHSTPPSIAFCPSAPEAASFQRLWATSKGRNDRVKEKCVPSPGAQRAVGLGRREEAESPQDVGRNPFPETQPGRRSVKTFSASIFPSPKVLGSQ